MQSLIERLPSDWQQDLPPLAAECRDVRLVGKIDRIDSFYDTDNKHIYRILDYKSANKPETPAKVHLTKKCPENFDTETLYAGNDSKGKDVYFCDMQLVIYSLFANFMHDETDIRDDSVIECGYYNLPLDTDETAIEIFSELDNAMLKNGAKTLILLMNRIFAERRFWPPSLKDPYGIAKVYLECDNINDFEINKESK
ncbi:MAG: PD-(D/E)XK nuclease family protein [Lentisphaeria bacterium]|nr:PD-(D/E)XK nuclease family protein [Lentisphaeria bacterium]